MSNKSVMLLCGNSCQRLEPVCIVCCSVFNSPVLHGLCHYVRGVHGELSALVHNFYNLFVHILGKTLLHLAKREYVLSENLFNIKYFAHSLIILSSF